LQTESFTRVRTTRSQKLSFRICLGIFSEKEHSALPAAPYTLVLPDITCARRRRVAPRGLSLPNGLCRWENEEREREREKQKRERGLTWLDRSTIAAPPLSVHPYVHPATRTVPTIHVQSATAPGASDTCCAFAPGTCAHALAMLTILSAHGTFRSFPFASSQLARLGSLARNGRVDEIRGRAHASAYARRRTAMDGDGNGVTRGRCSKSDRAESVGTTAARSWRAPSRSVAPRATIFFLLRRAPSVDEDTMDARDTKTVIEAIIAPPDDELPLPRARTRDPREIGTGTLTTVTRDRIR